MDGGEYAFKNVENVGSYFLGLIYPLLLLCSILLVYPNSLTNLSCFESLKLSAVLVERLGLNPVFFRPGA